MSNTDTVTYFNTLVKGLKKALYEQRGEGSRFRTYLVGREFFAEKLKEEIRGDEDWDQILNKVAKLLTDLKLVEGVEHSLEYVREFEDLVVGRVIHLKVRGCVHNTIDRELAEKKVPPYTLCPIANIIIYIADELKNRGEAASELVTAYITGSECSLTLSVFEHPKKEQAG